MEDKSFGGDVMDIYELDRQFNELIQRFPDARRELVEKAGTKMCQNVVNNISSSVQEDTGNLKRGVTLSFGSGGGYAAVRADHNIAPHSHLIENGHKVVRNGQIVGWVPGKHMYRNALNQLESELQQDAEQMVNRLVGEIFD